MEQTQRGRRRRITPRSLRDWGAVLPQFLGMAGLVACLVAYFLTGMANAAILTAFAGLIVVGQGAEAVSKIGSVPPDPEPDEEQKGQASS